MNVYLRDSPILGGAVTYVPDIRLPCSLLLRFLGPTTSAGKCAPAAARARQVSPLPACVNSAQILGKKSPGLRVTASQTARKEGQEQSFLSDSNPVRPSESKYSPQLRN